MSNVSFESSQVEKEDEVPRFQKDIKTEYKIQMKANQTNHSLKTERKKERMK